MLPTPSTSHVNYKHVYEPAEDSFLLLDTLSSATETAFLQAQFPADSPTPVILEVGTGSGVVLAFVTAHANRIISRPDVATVGVDVNRFACVATRETVQLAVEETALTQKLVGNFLDIPTADLTTAIRPGSVDMLVFNPPYVPSENLPSMPDMEHEGASVDHFSRDSHLLSLSTDGGLDGMGVTNRLLDQLLGVLSERGIAYILLSVSNRPEEVMSRIRTWASTNGIIWSADKVGSSGNKAGWERLCVIRIWRSGAPSDREREVG